MNVTIKPTLLTGKIDVISSKSLSHRYIIAAGLAEGTSHISNVLKSDDLKATKHALLHLGVTFMDELVHGGLKKYDHEPIDCNESGSTLRFMIPIALLYHEPITFIGKGRLPYRPQTVYEDVCKQKGLTFDKDQTKTLPLIVKGPLTGGDITVKGDISSQFISGLLFALPLLKEDSKIIYSTPLSSVDYIELTLDVLTTFGITYKKDTHAFVIPGNQRYLPRTCHVEGDFSQAAFWFVAATIGQPMSIYQLNHQSKQGDKRIIDLIAQMGGNISYDEKQACYHVQPAKTKGITIDLDLIPDLGPILMVLASLSEGTTVFTSISRLRIKESDRVDAMYQALKIMGVNMRIEDEKVYITGQKTLKGNVIVDGASDHRIVMALAIASQRATGPVTITHSEAIEKSYPIFFNDYRRLGGVIHEFE